MNIPQNGCEIVGAELMGGESPGTFVKSISKLSRRLTPHIRKADKGEGNPSELKKVLAEVKASRDEIVSAASKKLMKRSAPKKALKSLNYKYAKLNGLRNKLVKAKKAASGFQTDAEGMIQGAYGLSWDSGKIMKAAEAGKIDQATLSAALSGSMSEEDAKAIHSSVHGAGLFGMIIPLAVVAGLGYLALKG